MDSLKRKLWATFLCFLFGPFGLFYVSKKGGIILSAILILTLVVGFGAVVLYSIDHPASPEEINRLMAGQISGTLSGLAAILYAQIAIIAIDWLASMIWAFKSA